MAGPKCASSTAELQLCSEARSGIVAGTRMLCSGRALPRLALLIGFLPRKEQAARGWEMPLAPSWRHLCSCLAFALWPQEGLGAGGLHTAKGSSSESSVRGKGRASAGLLQRFLGRQTQCLTESTRLPGPLAGVCSPTHPEADSVGAQQVHDRRRFPSTLLASTDMCRWFRPDAACLGSRPQPQLRGSSP